MNKINIISQSFLSYKVMPSVEGFLQGHLDRFGRIKNILRNRYKNYEFVSINKIAETCYIICRIVKVIEMENSYNIFVDDPTGSICTTVLKKDNLADITKVLSGNILGLKIKAGLRNLVLEIVWPDITPIIPKTSSGKVYAALASDIHVGSIHFAKQAFLDAITYINDNQDIKYFILAGDLIDGIKVFPNQEKYLYLFQINYQYAQLAKYLNMLRDTVTCIIAPGNHETDLSILQPQPAYKKEIQKLFNKNCYFVENPCLLSIEDIKYLIYHGYSIDSIISKIPEFTYTDISAIMQYMLKTRLLVPTLELKNCSLPLPKCFLTIDDVPDILHTGHVHKVAIGMYKGVTLLNAGTWQIGTDYQKLSGMMPDVGQLLLVNLRNVKEVKVVHFYNVL